MCPGVKESRVGWTWSGLCHTLLKDLPNFSMKIQTSRVSLALDSFSDATPRILPGHHLWPEHGNIQLFHFGPMVNSNSNFLFWGVRGRQKNISSRSSYGDTRFKHIKHAGFSNKGALCGLADILYSQCSSVAHLYGDR